MGRYRKKPVIIEAVQYIEGKEGLAEVLRFAKDYTYKGGVALNGTIVLIPTLEGVMTARIGDWIIKGIQGEFYPCKPDIFEATYEKVEE